MAPLALSIITANNIKSITCVEEQCQNSDDKQKQRGKKCEAKRKEDNCTEGNQTVSAIPMRTFPSTVINCHHCSAAKKVKVCTKATIH